MTGYADVALFALSESALNPIRSPLEVDRVDFHPEYVRLAYK